MQELHSRWAVVGLAIHPGVFDSQTGFLTGPTPPSPPPSHANNFVTGTAVINTHTHGRLEQLANFPSKAICTPLAGGAMT